jgi:molybdate transport system substrate-binding protein
MLNRHSLLLAIILSMAAPVAPALADEEKQPAIAAAADLQFALTDIAAAFTEKTGMSVRLSFGSSGNFFRQIQEGAPFEMYLSADESFVLDLAKAERTEGEGELYAIGRIVVFVPHGSPVEADSDLTDIKAALADGRLAKFSIANPEHAPYGRRAEEALRHAGLWEAMQDHLLFGENVAQAAQFATTGGAQAGIFAYSLALSPTIARLGDFALIPESWHEALRQRMVLLKGAGPVAHAFYEFMLAPEARAVMRRYGFVLPGETG